MGRYSDESPHRVRAPNRSAKTVAFYSFGEALYGGAYYDTQSIENVLKAQCLLASEMNGQPLPEVYGAPFGYALKTSLATRWSNGLSASNSSNRRSSRQG